MKTCTECGDSFESYQHNQKRCYTCIGTQRPTKECPECGKEFSPRTVRHTFCEGECSTQGWLRGYLQRTYQISVEQYNDMYESSSGTCYICGTKGFKMNSKVSNGMCVDHCHTTGQVRGLLCHNCNRALGLFQDSKELLRRALSYLQRSETIPEGSTPKWAEAVDTQ